MMSRPKGTPQGYRVPGSGIKKGYEYSSPMAQHHRDSISKSLQGRDITWAHKIRDSRNELDVSSLLVGAWKTRRCTYVCTNEFGREYRTINLTKFCKKHGLSVSHMCRIARNKIDGMHGGGSRLHKLWDCRKVKHRGKKW